nr:alanine--tRNA ligase-related protein [Patescibacteria group bacterium]
MITANELRGKYLKFFESKGHAVIPSAPLVPENDPSTLFTGSGMQPMVPYLLGEKHPMGVRIVDSQKCFRSVEMDDDDSIGDNRHTTFFEMLGNWSLGDYFKKEQIEWMFEFLTKELELDPNRIYISVYRGNEKLGIDRDDETVELWQEQFKKVNIEAKAVDMAEKNGMQDGRIFYYDEKENWWSRSGVPDNMPVGEPGGPDSEMFWDFGPDLKIHENSEWKNQPCHPSCDCGRFLEIGNNVFMQYKKTEDGFEELKGKNIDFGGGLERLAVAVMDNPDVFMGDLFELPRKKLEEISGKKYGENEEETRTFRIIMDHI